MSDQMQHTNLPTPATTRHDVAWWIATYGGIGKSPIAPGTCGSLFALPVGWLILWLFGQQGLLIAVVATFFIGWFAAAQLCKRSDETDPQEIVIDEVVGQWIALFFLPFNWHWFIIAFVFFRIFDILKPFPIGESEKRFKGGFGVMIDDVIAGIFALGCTQAIYFIVDLFL